MVYCTRNERYGILINSSGQEVSSVKRIRPVFLIAVVVACTLTGVGLRLIPTEFSETSLPYGGALLEVPAVYVEEEATPYGAQVEVLSPGSDPLATEPYVEYSGGVILLRYYNTSGTFQAKVGKDNRSSTMTIYTDNSTHRIPLVYGEGTYTITIYEKMSDGRARTVATKKVSTTSGTSSGGTASAAEPSSAPSAESASTASGGGASWNIDTSDPYLTSTVDIAWDASLTSVKKARELCSDKTSDKEKAKAVYSHLVNRLSYDYDLVGKLPSGYTPSMDPTYSKKKGICYDIASLYAGMMRSVGVKCKLVMGYNTKVDGYHAWNEVYVDGAWHRVDITIDCQLREFGSSYGFSSPKGSVTVSKSY